MAENTSFVASFLRGVVDESKYRQLVANFYFIYHALETEVEKNKDNPFVGPMRLNGLSRHDALIKDCQYFYGDDWREKIYPTEETQRYVNRIHEVAKENPELLIAHHYTRYMGDLSGGQILKGIAQKALDLKDDGLAFFEIGLGQKRDILKIFSENSLFPFEVKQDLNGIDRVVCVKKAA